MFIVLAVTSSLLLTTRAASAPLAGAWEGAVDNLYQVGEQLARLLPAGANVRGVRDRGPCPSPNRSPKKRRRKSSSGSWKVVGAIVARPSTRIVTTDGATTFTMSAYDVRPSTDGRSG